MNQILKLFLESSNRPKNNFHSKVKYYLRTLETFVFEQNRITGDSIRFGFESFAHQYEMVLIKLPFKLRLHLILPEVIVPQDFDPVVKSCTGMGKLGINVCFLGHINVKNAALLLGDVQLPLNLVVIV